jgi:hypothetical protein
MFSNISVKSNHGQLVLTNFHDKLVEIWPDKWVAFGGSGLIKGG